MRYLSFFTGCDVAVFSTPGSISGVVNVFEMAVKADARLALAQSSLGATRARLKQSWAGVKPQVKLSANQRSNQGTYDYVSKNYSLTMTQSLFDYDHWKGIDVAAAQVSQEEALFEQARQDLMERVANVYFDLLSAKDALDLAGMEKEAIARELNLGKQRLAAGLFLKADVYVLQAAYDMAVAGELIAQSALDNAREAVNELTGQSMLDASELKGEVPLVRPDPERGYQCLG